MARLTTEIASLEEMCQPVAPDVAIGRVSRMDAINNKSVAEAALRNAKKKYHGLEYAMKNLDKDDFGICAKCRQSIPEGRILLVPESRYCVHCS